MIYPYRCRIFRVVLKRFFTFWKFEWNCCYWTGEQRGSDYGRCQFDVKWALWEGRDGPQPLLRRHRAFHRAAATRGSGTARARTPQEVCHHLLPPTFTPTFLSDSTFPFSLFAYFQKKKNRKNIQKWINSNSNKTNTNQTKNLENKIKATTKKDNKKKRKKTFRSSKWFI